MPSDGLLVAGLSPSPSSAPWPLDPKSTSAALFASSSRSGSRSIPRPILDFKSSAAAAALSLSFLPTLKAFRSLWFWAYGSSQNLRDRSARSSMRCVASFSRSRSAIVFSRLAKAFFRSSSLSWSVRMAWSPGRILSSPVSRFVAPSTTTYAVCLGSVRISIQPPQSACRNRKLQIGVV
ncbi:hypothetical protein Trco_000652 [Trichoderma cornu-damae]|uniref:Uncharacterized protein n=1 Tax=Trichoderma cornu-damae TaxID=654480 RepID=A0A9P8QXT3_9HYPO|nr:hypothetical protein Trco_000652 [Trichoderma cornu-damae]